MNQAAIGAYSDFPKAMGSVAPRELLANGIRSVAETAAYSEQELLAIHGVGPKAIRVLKAELRQRGQSLKG